MSIKKKAPKNPDIVALLQSGRKQGNTSFSVYVLNNKENKTRLFIATIAKKFVKKSTDRNLYKRRIKTVFKKNESLFEGKDMLIMARSEIASIKTFKELEANLSSLFENYTKRTK